MTVSNLSALKLELEKIVEGHDKPAQLSYIESCANSDNTGDVYDAGVSDGEYSLAKSILNDYFDTES